MNVFRSALSLVIHKKGNVSNSDIDDLIYRYKVKKGIILDKQKYTDAVQSATEHYKKKSTCLFVCTDSRCLEKTYLNPSKSSLDKLSYKLNCQIETTGCHWECENAPVLTLKSGNKSYSYLNCSTAKKWTEIESSIVSNIDPKQSSGQVSK